MKTVSALVTACFVSFAIAGCTSALQIAEPAADSSTDDVSDDTGSGGDAPPADGTPADGAKDGGTTDSAVDTGASGDTAIDVGPDVPSCVTPHKICAGACVDTQTDDAHCGDCGTTCSAGTTCTLGICKCPSTKIICGAACIDVASDPAHCGGCDKSCASGASCVSGKCSACPSAKPTVCGSDPGVCTDTTFDDKNCGACGKVCGSGASCKSGFCTCAAGLVDCGTGCKDLSSDSASCGSCGFSCGSGKCVSGACACTGSLTKCGGTCTDTSSDAANCGGCGLSCPTPGKCVASKCSLPKCRTGAPNVLFYGVTGSTEKAYLPTSAISTVASDASWRAMKTADFAKYDLIVIGEPAAGGGPFSADLLAAYDTRAAWGAAITGRIVVSGMDPAYHAGLGTTSAAGATTFLKATLQWVSGGPPGTTSLYVSSDWATRKLDFLSPIGVFSSDSTATSTVTITVASHPVMLGSTSSSLSGWSSSAHSFLRTYPTSFTSIATATDTFTTTTTGPVELVRDNPACVP